MGMTDQRLPPRVEDAQDPDLGPEMAWVGGDVAQRRRANATGTSVRNGVAGSFVSGLDSGASIHAPTPIVG
jgi:hypothetical protein